MTDLLEKSKRDRLVASAADLFHRQGVYRTSLADVAADAGVPLGNVYYYFKTKDDLIVAVVGSLGQQFQALLRGCEQRPTPAARLKALAASWVDMRDVLASYGCPIGSLNAELGKSDTWPDLGSGELLSLLIDWAETQFRQIGRKGARDRAVGLIGALQGAALLTNVLRDPELMTRQVRQLDRWIDSLP